MFREAQLPPDAGAVDIGLQGDCKKLKVTCRRKFCWSRGELGAFIRPGKIGPAGKIAAASMAATMSKLMDKRTLQRWIREANAAAALASETALARERRVAKVKQSARKIETRIKIQLGAEALRLLKGAIAETAFKRMVADAAREIDEIDQALRASGLRRHVGKEEPANQNVLPPASVPVAESLENVDGIGKIELGFARVPPEHLRNALKGKFGFRYDAERQVWRGRAVPEQVADEIRVCNAGGLVKIFVANGKPGPLP